MAGFECRSLKFSEYTVVDIDKDVGFISVHISRISLYAVKRQLQRSV
jgi:hypothetical protein